MFVKLVKILSNVIILNIFKTNDIGKTHLSPKNKISKIFCMSRDQIPLKDRTTLVSSISVNIHLAHPGHVQNESIRLSQQNDA